MPADIRALRDAGFILKRALQAASPTAKARKSWSLRTKRTYVEIKSSDVGVIAVNSDWRHPLFGDKEGQWYQTNQRHPDRTGFVGRAVDASASDAAERYADEQIRVTLEKYGFK
jgi:hypothetical protein